MAYVDKQLTFSDQQAVTATAVSSNALDVTSTAPLRDIGVGEPMFIDFSCQVSAAAAGAATVTFEVIQADDAALTSNVTSLASSGAIGKAALTAGSRIWSVALPRTSQRYIGVRYTVATGPLTAGTFTADLRLDRGAQASYASGYPNAF
jgi:hypothetical protein